jgi:hypothetical protein
MPVKVEKARQGHPIFMAMDVINSRSYFLPLHDQKYPTAITVKIGATTCINWLIMKPYL